MTKISRTITITTLDIMTVNTETAKVEHGTYRVPEFENIKKPEGYFRAMLDYGSIRYVTHNVVETNETTYVCTLEDFLTVAKPLDK